jgi:hypothetical protein
MLPDLIVAAGTMAPAAVSFLGGDDPLGEP